MVLCMSFSGKEALARVFKLFPHHHHADQLQYPEPAVHASHKRSKDSLKGIFTVAQGNALDTTNNMFPVRELQSKVDNIELCEM